jgi:dihydroorotate dehydrogenase
MLRRALKTPLIPSGGIETGYDVIQVMMAGAEAVQICTAVYRDLDIIKRMIREMEWFMSKKGYSSLHEIVGITLEHLPFDLIEVPLSQHSATVGLEH